MIDFLQRVIYGNTEYLKHSDLAKLTRRHPFSAFLNYLAYDQKNEIYVNQDSTLGMLWECSPLTYAGERAMSSLEGIFRAGMPHGTIIQFILHADSHIEPIIERYRTSRTRTEAIVTTNTERVTEFLTKGKKGLEACSNIPVRNFRLFIAVKIPGDSPGLPKPDELGNKEKVAPLLDIKRQINETLKATQLYPRHLSPGNLLEWLRRLLNSYPEGYPEHNFSSYSPDIPLLKQIVNADTVIKEGSDHIQAGDNFFCCTTPKSFPREVDPLQTNSLFGGIWGIISDADQIKTDFLYSFNIVFQKGLDVSIHAKTNLMLNQQAVGSLSTLLHRKQAEHMEATDDLEHGVKFLKIIPVFWVWSDDLEKARDSCTRVRRLWENNGYVMQQDNMVLKILFISSLPLCLYADGKNIENLERDFTAPVPSITPLLPVQGDFAGSGGIPNLIFTGRKGQLISLDFFAKGATNFNAFCCATSGSGKSFLVNFIAFNYYACGSIVRIIDIGGSYKKIADMLGARYLDFSPEIKMCLNPFTNILEPDEELKSVAAVFAQMAYANSDTRCDDTELNLFRLAVRWAWDQKGQDADSDTVYEFLQKFPDLPGMENLKEMTDNKELIATARRLGFNVLNFTSKGFHGKFFCGPSTFDIRNDEFVVLELENLKVQPDLYKVVTLLIINAVTQDLYLSDRSRHRQIIFDEAWQFLDKSAMLAPVVNEGYRRARKYSGSFMVITQSILDLEYFGEVGSVIKGNSAFKIFLESSDFDQAKKKGLIDYEDFSMKLLKSIKSNPPHYSEIFFDTPFGIGPTRLVVNDYAYFIYTSKASEIAMIEQRVKSGMTYHEAILEMVELRKNGEL
ncbi:MAG: TraC family protein [Proteobacteria bacterium]|nr:TraC family protein [Pseudomonadota bacterium]MBU1649871.1 TraC family protein [Pseudomonadota bacterium]